MALDILTTTLPMHQSQTWTTSRTLWPVSKRQKSVYNSSSGSHVPDKMPNHLHLQMRRRNKTVHPDLTKQVTVFTGGRCLLAMPMIPLIRSPLLYIAPQHFTYAPLRHALNSHHPTLRIALWWQQYSLLQYMLWPISRHDAPITDNQSCGLLPNR